MKPWIELARARADGGGVLSLHRRGEELVIRVDGQELMSSRRHGSEESLAQLGCARGPRHLLVGGLGMGFTARTALRLLDASARLVVAELSADVVAWNRDLMGAAAASTLTDSRVTVRIGDVGALISAARAEYDAILLDVDNSPHALTHPANRALYAPVGLARAHRALRPGGRLAVWSASRHPEFEARLRNAGFTVETHGSRASGGRHTVYVADR